MRCGVVVPERSIAPRKGQRMRRIRRRHERTDAHRAIFRTNADFPAAAVGASSGAINGAFAGAIIEIVADDHFR